MNNFIIYFDYKYNGDWDKIYHAFKNFENVDDDLAKQIARERIDLKEKIITILDDEYPAKLDMLRKPPFALHYLGNYSLINFEKSFCLTGNLEKDYIVDLLCHIDSLAKDVLVVLPSWKGINEKILEKCLTNDQPILVISKCGLRNEPFLEKIDFAKHKNVLVISEYPNKYHISRKTIFAYRRIVAALANNLVLLATSGPFLNNLVNNFLDCGKEVFCFAPEPNDNENSNLELINLGATLINDLTKPSQTGILVKKTAS